MKKLIIVGHKNPDTDSIISAIAAQEYFSKVLQKEAEAYRAGEINNETKFILQNFGIDVPKLLSNVNEDESVVLVDHNQAAQVADGVNYAQVEFVLDHHSLSITTERPINMRVEPIGSTSSLIAKMFFEKGVDPSEKTAKLLLAGILSDMLDFTSPTTTEEDKILAEKLNVIAKLDLESFVSEMFKAKSSLEGISIEEIISLDYKNFEMGTKKVGIGTWETTLPESVNMKKAEIIYALRDKKKAEKLDYIFFMVVDILKSSCELYIVGEEEKELAQKVFGKDPEMEAIVLPGVVSRKKQIVPQLTEALA